MKALCHHKRRKDESREAGANPIINQVTLVSVAIANAAPLQ